jgi:predicted esterase
MLALPLSTQMASPLSHVWDDREKALSEVEEHFKTLIGKYPVDANRIVFAGFSQGAARAIEIVMSQRLEARGFIAVVPGTLDLAELEGWVGTGTRKARGVLVSGGRDPHYDRFIQIKEMFEKHYVPMMFENYPEMAHQIPNDFESVLQKGLKFILQENHDS